MITKQTRKSTDGQGLVYWWYDNGWRIVRSPSQKRAPRYSYRVETANHWKPYRCAAEACFSLSVARHILKSQLAV